MIIPIECIYCNKIVDVVNFPSNKVSDDKIKELRKEKSLSCICHMSKSELVELEKSTRKEYRDWINTFYSGDEEKALFLGGEYAEKITKRLEEIKEQREINEACSKD